MRPLATGRVASVWRITPPDYGALFDLMTSVECSYSWRHRGTTPSFEDFRSHLFEGVVTIAAIRSAREGEDAELRAFCAVYDLDLRSGTAYCTVAARPGAAFDSAIAPEGALLVLRQLIRDWPIRKVFFDRPAYLEGSGALERHLAEEGRLSQRVYYDGAYHDLRQLSVTRDQIKALYNRVRRSTSVRSP